MTVYERVKNMTPIEFGRFAVNLYNYGRMDERDGRDESPYMGIGLPDEDGDFLDTDAFVDMVAHHKENLEEKKEEIKWVREYGDYSLMAIQALEREIEDIDKGRGEA